MATSYKPTGTGSSNVTRTSQRVKDAVKDFGGGEGDESQLLNGLVALGYDPQLIRSFSDADPNRRFLNDAVTRAMRAGVDYGDIQKALAASKAATNPDPVQRARDIAQALGLDMVKVTQTATTLAGQQGRAQPTPEQWNQAISQLGGTTPEAASSLTALSTGGQGLFLAKGQTPAPAPAAPAPAPAAGPPEALAPAGSAHFVQQRGGSPADQPQPAAAAAPATPAAPATTKAPVLAPTDWEGKAIPKTPEELSNYIKQNYGFAAMALDIPEINGILHDAAVHGWGPDVVKGKVSLTNWWKTHDDAERQWTDLEKNDPSTAGKRIQQQLININQQAVGQGVQLDPRRADQLARLSLIHGWSSGQTAQALASEYQYDPSGQKAGVTQQMQTMAHNYMVTLSPQAYTQWGQGIIAGNQSMDTFKDYLTTQAKSLLPGMATQLDQGMDVKTYIDPYIQRAASILDLDPQSIDFTDSKWIKFINQTDPKTGQRVPMNLSDMESTIKSDPIYGYDKTKAAHQEASTMSSYILQKFGKL